MNRREFTASLAAMVAAPALPLPARTAAPAAIPPGAYGWAQLIARAQNRCDPAMLARQLHLSADAAQSLFNQMLRDGVLRAPGLAGVAQAAKPLQVPGASAPTLTERMSKLHDLISEGEPDAHEPPLAKDPEQCLGCPDTESEDQAHASETQSIQKSPQER